MGDFDFNNETFSQYLQNVNFNLVSNTFAEKLLGAVSLKYRKYISDMELFIKKSRSGCCLANVRKKQVNPNPALFELKIDSL